MLEQAQLHWPDESTKFVYALYDVDRVYAESQADPKFAADEQRHVSDRILALIALVGVHWLHGHQIC